MIFEKTFFQLSQGALCTLAQTLAPHFDAGQSICLQGPIGAGKSVFARALILTLLEEEEDIPSPSFTLVQIYDAPSFEIWHCDFYRMDSVDPAGELGLLDAFDTALCIMEWPERLTAPPHNRIMQINISVDAKTDLRNITISTDIPALTTALKAQQ